MLIILMLDTLKNNKSQPRHLQITQFCDDNDYTYERKLVPNFVFWKEMKNYTGFPALES